MGVNTSLAYRDNEYKNNGVSVSSNDCINLVAKIKRIDEYKWLNEADSMALQQVLRDQQTAFSNFFRDNKKFRYPRFKSRKNNVNTYRTNCQNNSIRISCDEKRIKLPKIGWVKIKLSRNDFSSIHHATISRNSSGQYYVSLTCDADIDTAKIKDTEKAVGIDAGIKEFAILSDGERISNPSFYKKAEERMTLMQRKLSRCMQGSNRYLKMKKKLAKQYQRTVNRRDDFLHKLSSSIIRENQTIKIEDLKVSNMIRNHHLSKSISDASWGRFFGMLEYKAKWYGREFVRVDRYYPSSQMCSECGYINKKVKNLSVRSWVCPECLKEHDRDMNAAINILNYSLI